MANDMSRVQHFEIPADDIARATKFYTETLGWKIVSFPMPDGSEYNAIVTGPMGADNKWTEPGFINGGMVKRGGPFPITGPTIAAVVMDIDASLEKIKSAGGAVLAEKVEIGGMGWYAYIKDTEGNTIGIWQDIKK